MTNMLSCIILALLAVVLFTLVDPFMYWMPNIVQIWALVFSAALLALWAGLLMREEAGDERELSHRMYAGRVAYLSGVVTLTLALVIQGFGEVVDPWIPITLIVMVAAKILARLYSEHSH